MHPRGSHLRPRSLFLRACALVLGIACAAQLPGCGQNKAAPATSSRYDQLPPKTVPAFLKGSVYEKADLLGTEPLRVSGYGLVANLHGTGNSEVPTPIRDYMIKEMTKHGYGSKLLPGMETVTPSRVLSDPRFAIVKVEGLLPAGVRRDEPFDVDVSAVPESRTTSLAAGDLYHTTLKINGAYPMNPGAAVVSMGHGQGPLFVNPAYALENDTGSPAARRSLRRGAVIGGGISMTDRALVLRIRAPQRSVARRIEARINERFQQVADRAMNQRGQPGMGVAEMTDEAIVEFYVPRTFKGNWEHLSQVVTHLYLDNSPGFVARKAQELAAEATKPDAPLGDITYCWEGLGPTALPHFRDLMTHDRADVAYAAARAALFLSDPAAPEALVRIARTPNNPFRLNAIQALGALPPTPAVSEMIRPLLAADETLVRIEAYRVLANNKDNAVFSKVIKEKFVLDIVRAPGPPLVYATRTGLPRIAVIGERAALATPITFTAMRNQLSISSDAKGFLKIFYRGPDVRRPVAIDSRPDLAEVIARLGGEGWEGSGGLNFNYGQIVSILSNLSQGRKLTAVAVGSGSPVSAPFVLEELPGAQDPILAAPVIGDTAPTGRPQADAPPAAPPTQDAAGNKVGLAN